MQEQIAKLRDVPDIIVATPSRLVQHLKEGSCCCAFGVVPFGNLGLSDHLYRLYYSQAVYH